MQYALATTFTMSSAATVSSCLLSAEFPGLTLNRNLASKTTINDPGGDCQKVNGPSTSLLIPLTSCSCDESFSLDGLIIYTNCGLRDPNCCDACTSGMTCSDGMCG